MQAVILAAGMGSRLGEMTKNIPKPLIFLNGKTLLGRKLDKLLQVKDISEIIIVVGHMGEKIEEFVKSNYPEENIRVIYNPNYKKGGVITLLKSEPYIKEGFILLNADHLFSSKVYQKLVQEMGGLTICSFLNRKPYDDEMKIKYHENGPVELSKKHQTYDAGYCGLASVSKEAVEDYFKIAKEMLVSEGEMVVPESLVLPFSKKGLTVKNCDLSEYNFVEVDTPEDYSIAQEKIKLVDAEDSQNGRD